jgi:hypothetical protein
VSITITIKYQHSLKMALKTFTTADGSANQALVTNGSGVLSFAAVGASAGQVIQVLSATDSTSRSTTSTSFVTGSNTLSVTITPSSASNKILILVSSTIANDQAVYATVFRDATNLGTGNGFVWTEGDPAIRAFYSGLGINYLDSPSTTSATTYQVYFRRTGGSTGQLNSNGTLGSITCLEIKG